jgi:hypothetical protein
LNLSFAIGHDCTILNCDTSGLIVYLKIQP